MSNTKRVPWWEIGGDTKPAGDDGKSRPCAGCQRIRCPEQCLYAPVSTRGGRDLIAAYRAAAAETFGEPPDDEG